jgi:hypothetical protein
MKETNSMSREINRPNNLINEKPGEINKLRH